MAKTIGLINKIKHCISAKAKRTLYCSLVLPYINYCNVVWACTYHSKLDKMNKLQKRVIKIIANVGFLSHTESLFSKYCILSVFELNQLQIGMLMVKCMKLKTTLFISILTRPEVLVGSISSKRELIIENFHFAILVHFTIISNQHQLNFPI